MTTINTISAMNPELKTETAVRCSIILLAGNNFSRLCDYLLYLSNMNLSGDYDIIVINDHGLEIEEGLLRAFLPALKILDISGFSSQEQLFKNAATVAKGNFLLFIRNLIHFDKLILEESIKELETSGEKLSVSANNNFMLAEKLHYTTEMVFERPFEGINSDGKTKECMPSGQIDHFRSLHNENVPFRCGSGTFIDPEVIIESPESVKIGSNCIIRKGVVLRPEGGEIIIGDNCVINHYCVFNGKGGIYIGDWTIVGPHCGFYAENQTYEKFDVPITKQPNTGRGIYLMGDNWIGGHSVICDDVTIGKGAVVGANSTVIKTIPMATITEGSPAKTIKKRYKDAFGGMHRDVYENIRSNLERAASEGMHQEVYEYVRKRGMLIKELIDEADSVLDVGCGEGIVTAILAEKNPNIIGCDYSIEALEIAKTRHPHIQFFYSNSTNLVFNDESFTNVTMSDVAEHLLPIQLIKTLREIKRVLKKGGILILATPITGKGKNALKYAHIYEYSEREIGRILCETFCKVKLINKSFGIFIAEK